MEIDGVEVGIDGPPRGRVVLMVHGWPDTCPSWDTQVAALRSRWPAAR